WLACCTFRAIELSTVARSRLPMPLWRDEIVIIIAIAMKTPRSRADENSLGKACDPDRGTTSDGNRQRKDTGCDEHARYRHAPHLPLPRSPFAPAVSFWGRLVCLEGSSVR